VAGILCGVSCALNASKGEYWSAAQCRFQSFYIVWFLTANSWVNATVARQLHQLLASSHHRRRYKPPTRKHVIISCGVVYLYAAVLGTVSLWEVSWLPYRTNAMSGEICLPVEYSVASTVFYFLAFVPLTAGIPMLYVMYVAADIWWRQLLPPKGKRRLLAIYFARILGAFFFLWTPYLLAVFLAWGEPWGLWATSFWGHMQGAIAAGLSLLKPDIRKGFLKFVTWGRYQYRATTSVKEEPKHEPHTHTNTTSSSEDEADGFVIPSQGDDFQYADERAERNTDDQEHTIHIDAEEALRLRESSDMFHPYDED